MRLCVTDDVDGPEALPLWVNDAVTLSVCDGLCESVALAVELGVPVDEDDTDWDGERVDESVGLCVDETLSDWLGVPEDERVTVSDGVTVPLDEGVGVAEDVEEPDGDCEAVGVAADEPVEDDEGVSETDCEGVGSCVPV